MFNFAQQSGFRIALLALGMRLGFILIFPGPNYYEGISQGYLDAATNMLEGRGIVSHVDIAPVTSPESHWSYEKMIDRPLGYLFLVFIPYTLFSSVGIQLLHALLAACSTVLLLNVSINITTEAIATRAAFVYAVWPLSARFEVAILPDAVVSFFLLLMAWWLVKALQSENKVQRFFLAGLASGLVMTMRADVILLPAFVAAGIFWFQRSQRIVKGALLFLVGAGIVVAAHTVRNYDATGGKIVPLALGNGISMWEGVSQFGDTLGTVFGDERLMAREGYRHWAYPNGVERDRKRFSEAVSILLSHPGFYATLMLKRLALLVTPDWIMTNKFHPSLRTFLNESNEHTVGDYIKRYPLPSILRLVLTILQFSSLVLATIALVRKPREPLFWIPAVVIFYYIAIHLPTNTEARYFYPAVPFVLLLASAGWERLKSASSVR